MLVIDESSLMHQPVVRRTWAPKGQTPVMYCWDRHDRISVLSDLSWAPRAVRPGLSFGVHNQNIEAGALETLLRDVQRHLRRPQTVVWDRWSAHRIAARLLKADAQFQFELFPAYAPDLNPVEHAWNRKKHTNLANCVPDDDVELECAVDYRRQTTRQSPKLLRSYFHATNLKM